MTVIGLPRKKLCKDKPVKFLKKGKQEREKQILDWMLPDNLVAKAQQGYSLEAKELGDDLFFSLNLLDENVNWVSVQRFFTKSTWIRVTNAMMELAKDPQYLCGSCHKDLHLSHSIICEACLTWYHLRCPGLAVAPKRTDWFCRVCHSTDDLIERKKATTERKVNNYYRVKF